MAFPAVFNLAEINGKNGFFINPALNAKGMLGFAAASIGDVNGDRVDDIAVSAPYSSSEAGEIYVIFGKNTTISKIVKTPQLDGRNGFTIKGINNGDHSGWSISRAGDVNGDGIADIVIGAPDASPSTINNAGQAYVIYGSNSPFGSVFQLSSLNGINGFIVNGLSAGDSLGISVSSAGDMNGDGFDDIVIGADQHYLNQNYPRGTGKAYIIFGSRNLLPPIINLEWLNGLNGFSVNGISSSDHLGGSVSGGGDINGDGFADIVLCSEYENSYGKVYVIFGNNGGFANPLSLSKMNDNTGFKFSVWGTEKRPVMVSTGDIDGDGLNDILVGAKSIQQYIYENGFVVYGRSEDFTDGYLANGLQGFTISGASQFFGMAIANLGDVNGDGSGDIIVGAPNQYEKGKSYVIFDNGFISKFTIDSLNGKNGFVINGINAGDNMGSTVSSAGDVNGDGISDILVSARKAFSNIGGYAGQAYVIYGQNTLELDDFCTM